MTRLKSVQQLLLRTNLCHFFALRHSFFCCYGWLQVFIILNFFFFFKETLVTQYQLLLNSKYTKELVYRPWTSCPEFSDLTTYLITLVTIYPETLIFCIVFLCRLIVLLGPVCELKPRPSFRSTYHAQTVQSRFVKQIEQKFVAFFSSGTRLCAQWVETSQHPEPAWAWN